MASGRLAGQDIAVTTAVDLYTPTAALRGVGTLTLCNRTSAAIAARVAVTSGASAPGNGDWEIYDLPVRAVGQPPLKNSGMIVGAGQHLWVQLAAVGVTATFNGIEEADE